MERAVRIDRLAAEVAGEAGRCETYLSLNRFHGRRRIDTLAQLAALAIDLDYYKLPALERLPAAIIAAQACDDLGSVAKFAGRRGVPRRRHRQAAIPNRLAMKVAWAGMSLAGMAATCLLRTIARIS